MCLIFVACFSAVVLALHSSEAQPWFLHILWTAVVVAIALVVLHVIYLYTNISSVWTSNQYDVLLGVELLHKSSTLQAISFSYIGTTEPQFT